jgi:hypothetical protein
MVPAGSETIIPRPFGLDSRPSIGAWAITPVGTGVEVSVAVAVGVLVGSSWVGVASGVSVGAGGGVSPMKTILRGSGVGGWTISVEEGLGTRNDGSGVTVTSVTSVASVVGEGSASKTTVAMTAGVSAGGGGSWKLIMLMGPSPVPCGVGVARAGAVSVAVALGLRGRASEKSPSAMAATLAGWPDLAQMENCEYFRPGVLLIRVVASPPERGR